jgi:glycosyltransferase involved in cell wall biosynthesis
LYSGARALIAPSVGYEVFPLVVLEAFRHGTPVIARRIGPYPEIIEASAGGLLFQNAAELDAAITSFTIDAARRQTMGEAGERAFRARWSEAAALAEYLDLIRSVAARRGLVSLSEALAPPGK